LTSASSVVDYRGVRDLRLLQTVRLLVDLPAHGLVRGDVGTIVATDDRAVEVEFVDHRGRTTALVALSPDAVEPVRPS
jgi:hypothetical protein